MSTRAPGRFAFYRLFHQDTMTIFSDIEPRVANMILHRARRLGKSTDWVLAVDASWEMMKIPEGRFPSDHWRVYALSCEVENETRDPAYF